MKQVKAFFDSATSTLTYIVWDESSKDAIIIDPVLDYDAASSTYSYPSVDQVMGYVNEKGLQVHLIMETHAHADHLSGAQELKRRIPNAKTAIGEHITQVQRIFKDVFNIGDRLKTDGSQFDHLLKEGQKITAGTIEINNIHNPGHTPACSSYLIDDMVFTGDALFMPDFGVARCDFPGGDAATLYHSVKDKLYQLPDSTRVFTGHDYQPGGRDLRYEATIGESKKSNIHIKAETTEKEFVEFRTNRDKTLSAPKLLLPSVEVNIDAGALPPPENNGVSYLKIPLREKKA